MDVGVLFGNKHSYRDLKMVMVSSDVEFPSAKTNYVDVPGSNGKLDLTEALTKDVKFNNRNIRLEFSIKATKEKWKKEFSRIANAIHGSKMKVVLDEDPTFYYIARVSVDEVASSNTLSKIVVNCDAEPFKYEQYSSLDDWLWDDFDFDTGIIREYSNIAVEGEKTLKIEGRRMQVIPNFIVESQEGLNVAFKGYMYKLPNGNSRVVNIVLEEGENTLDFFGNGTVSVDYRGGEL